MIRGIRALSMLLVGCLLSGHVLAAPVTAPSSGSAIVGDVTTYILLDSPDVDDIEPYGIKSAALKKALRKVASMLRSSELEDVLGWLEKEAGIRAIKVVRKHAVTIANTLDSLAKWETVSMLIVREQLVAALQGVGLARSTCFEAAFWIEKFISWTML